MNEGDSSKEDDGLKIKQEQKEKTRKGRASERRRMHQSCVSFRCVFMVVPRRCVVGLVNGVE
jgi:hypothetical protein